MAPRLPSFGDFFRGRNGGGPNNPEQPDLSGQTQPNGALLGHTQPYIDPGDIQPRLGQPPIGGSGRANFYGLPQLDELNQKLAGVRGLQIFDDMYWTDAHIRRLVLAAWSPLVAGTWALEAYGGEEASDQDKEIADAIWWMLTEWMTPNLTGHLYEVGPALLRFGFVPFEQQWDTCEYKGKTLMGVKKLGFMLPRTIWKWWQDDYGELTHIGQILPNKPEVTINATDLTYYRLAMEGDNWMGRSMLRHAYKHWYLKDKLERIDAIGQERKAVGVPVVYVSPDTPTQTRKDLEKAIANLHVSEVAYLQLPGWKMGEAPTDSPPANQFLVDIIKFDSSSGSDIKSSIEYHQLAITASFLEDFLELGHHQVGARATAEVQEDPFLTAINGALLPPVIPPLNALIDRIRKLNWASADGSPQLRLTLHDEASLSEISAYVLPLVQANALQVDSDLEDWLRDRAAMPAANPDVRKATEAARMAGLENAAKLAEAGETPGEEPAGANKAGAVTNDSSGQLQPANASKGQGTPASKQPADTAPAKSKQLEQAAGPAAAGLIVHAADTGRVLMIQRTDDKHDDDDTRARWEFGGGKIEDGETPHQGGLREWSEETGAKLPANAKQLGNFTTADGKYRAFGYRIPKQAALKLGNHDPDEVAAVRWWHPDELHTDDRIRGKVQQMLPQVHQLIGTKRALDQPEADDSDLVCVDFDGVIHPRDANSDAPPLGDAAALLGRITQKYKISILTARSDLAYVRAYLQQHGLGQYASTVTNKKPPAIAYVDDRAVHPNGDLERTLEKIEQRRIGLDQPTPPPNLRASTNPAEECATCKMLWQGECGGYWNWPVRDNWVCDSWVKSEVPAIMLDGDSGFAPLSGGVGTGESGLQMVGEIAGDATKCKCENPHYHDGRCTSCGGAKRSRPKKPAAAGDVSSKTVRKLDTAAAEPTAKWWERLLSQHQLRQAFDGCRDHIEASVGRQARVAAQQLANQAANGADIANADPPAQLVDALTKHYEDMYHLGRQTVELELAKQRHALGKQLDTGTDVEGGLAARRLQRARQRGEHSARNIVNKVTEVLGRQQITGLKDAPALDQAATAAASGQLRMEALANVAGMINDGRADAAQADPQVTGAYYTSVLDPSTCDACEEADNGDFLSPDEAILLGPPNPDCAGSDRCRCALVWVLSDDPAALASVVGDAG